MKNDTTYTVQLLDDTNHDRSQWQYRDAAITESWDMAMSAYETLWNPSDVTTKRILKTEAGVTVTIHENKYPPSHMKHIA